MLSRERRLESVFSEMFYKFSSFLIKLDKASLIKKQWNRLSKQKFQSHRLASSMNGAREQIISAYLSFASNDRWIKICYRQIHKSLTPFMADERLVFMI